MLTGRRSLRPAVMFSPCSMPPPAYAATRASQRAYTLTGFTLVTGRSTARTRYVAVSSGLWAYKRFRPCRTIGWNYRRARRPFAGKSSFSRDRVVIKYGHSGLAGDATRLALEAP